MGDGHDRAHAALDGDRPAIGFDHQVAEDLIEQEAVVHVFPLGFQGGTVGPEVGFGPLLGQTGLVGFAENRFQRVFLLVQLAEASGLPERIEAMFSGARINVTENRPVLHTALRAAPDDRFSVDGEDVVAPVHAVLDAMTVFVERVRNGQWRGHSGMPIKTVVNTTIHRLYIIRILMVLRERLAMAPRRANPARPIHRKAGFLDRNVGATLHGQPGHR